MKEVTVTEELICPWCYAMIEVNNSDDTVRCKVCERIITESDLENEEFKEE